jgi:hypothetical protein
MAYQAVLAYQYAERLVAMHGLNIELEQIGGRGSRARRRASSRCPPSRNWLRDSSHRRVFFSRSAIAPRLTDVDLRNDLGGRLGRRMQVLNGGAAGSKPASKERIAAEGVFVPFLPDWSPIQRHTIQQEPPRDIGAACPP